MPRLVIVVLVLVVAMPAALAADLDEIVESLSFRGYYLEEGTEASIDEMEGLVSNFPGMYFVALAADPPEGADALAEDALNRLGDGTVLVISPGELGAYSNRYTSDELIGGLQAASGESYHGDFRLIAERLAGARVPPAATTAADTGREEGGAGGALLAVAAIALVAGIAFYSWRNSRREQASREGRLDEAKEEIRKQLGVIANQIIDFSDRVSADRFPEAVAHYRRGNEIFDTAEERLASATGLDELEALSDQLDEARWELEAAEAIVEGRSVPERPEGKPEACFFDPTHGAGVEQAEIRTPAGTRTVWVCHRDAEKLRQGERPEPRTIPVGGSRVPAPVAPRSHGGAGFDWLDAFSILVGGLGDGIPYDWSGSRRRRFPPGGGRTLVWGGVKRSRPSQAPGSAVRRRERFGRARRSR